MNRLCAWNMLCVRAAVLWLTATGRFNVAEAGDHKNKQSLNGCIVAVSFALLIARALLVVPSAEAASVTLPGATTLVGLGGICGFMQFDCPPLRLGSTESIDVTNLGVRQNLEATATPFGPTASVQGEISGPRGEELRVTDSAEATVDYEVEVVPVGVGLVLKVASVPVTLMASVEASGGGSLGFVFARVEVFGAGLSGTIVACGNLPPDVCVDSPTNSITGRVLPNTPISLDLDAVGEATSNGEFQASADPVFAIADAIIPGTSINFRDAFTVEVSPGVTQSLPAPGTPVPEPSTLWLLSVGCAGAFTYRRVHHRRQRRPT
jgi:PEP-CTERM motif